MKNTHFKLFKINSLAKDYLNLYHTSFILLCTLIIPVVAVSQETKSKMRIVDIEEKIYTAKNGDIVSMEPGTYYGTLLLENLQNLTLDFTNVELLTKQDVTIFTLTNCSNIKIIGLTIRHDIIGCFTNCFDVNTCDNISFINCDINGSGFIGICVNKSSGIKVDSCKIHQCTVGIFLWEHNEIYDGIPAITSDVTVRECVFDGNKVGNICFDKNYADLIDFKVTLNGEKFMVTPNDYKNNYLLDVYYIIH